MGTRKMTIASVLPLRGGVLAAKRARVRVGTEGMLGQSPSARSLTLETVSYDVVTG